ncbi:Crp/Fnr family transcriptional regulator [Microbispora catharanthi]|uniref:Cyclic nucleotide-binding domain-containing protein n=1 Tax=Microbispora catharanthi TaxID=1712871 RepID=A0A5N6AYC2_9ACTN|nr:Crp/Fnr family transcriptional regulator [Microbispora catharanthi]KAB8173777.1 cyclic nucleotide-binding domain-containing protein [Microbispora catharanthi]
MTQSAERRTWLHGSFLDLLPVRAREELLRLGSLLTYPSRHMLIREGDPGHAVYLLVDALVKVTASTENGSRTLLSIRASGDIVGEMAALTDHPRMATVTTCRRSLVCVLKGPVFTAYLARIPESAAALSQVTIDRLRFADRRRLDFAGYEADICLARILVDLAVRHGRPRREGIDIGVPVTQSELGELIGIKERTVQKAMHDLSARGLVLQRHRGVIIRNLDGLTDFADLRLQSPG